jgi:hypothetical protein
MLRVSNAFKAGDQVVVYRSGAYYSAVIESVESNGVYLVCRDPARSGRVPTTLGSNARPSWRVVEDDIHQMI